MKGFLLCLFALFAASHCRTFSSSGWSVGQGGTILRTTNAGVSWDDFSVLSADLVSVHAVSENVAFAAGAAGTIWTTANGANWTRQASNTFSFLHAIRFWNVSQGIAVGNNGTVITTNNGGPQWTVQPSPSTAVLHGVAWASETGVVAVGSAGTVLVSQDRGRTWDTRTVRSFASSSLFLMDVTIVTDSTGTQYAFVVGTGDTIVKSRGPFFTVWEFVDVGGPDGGSPVFTHVSFRNTLHGAVVGYNGTHGIISQTNDGGQTWNFLEIGNLGVLWGVSFVNSQVGVIVGASTLLRTSNGGDTWPSLSLSSISGSPSKFPNLNSVSFAPLPVTPAPTAAPSAPTPSPITPSPSSGGGASVLDTPAPAMPAEEGPFTTTVIIIIIAAGVALILAVVVACACSRRRKPQRDTDRVPLQSCV